MTHRDSAVPAPESRRQGVLALVLMLSVCVLAPAAQAQPGAPAKGAASNPPAPLVPPPPGSKLGPTTPASQAPAPGSPNAPGSPTSAAPDYPRRKVGLWEIRSVGSQAVGLPAMQFCVGELTDTAATHLDRTPGTRGACTMGAFRRTGEAWLSESVCRETRAIVSSRAVASGNFESEYRIDTLVTYDPPLGGVRREDKDAVVARWLGACAATQRPGDMIIPGMGTLNMNDGGFRPEPEPRPPGKRRAAAPDKRRGTTP